MSYYLPEMTGTAYREATLRQVLDMQIGVDYSELYADPKAHIWDYARAGGLRSRPRDYAGPDQFLRISADAAQGRRSRRSVRLQNRQHRSDVLGHEAGHRHRARRTC